MYTKNVLARGNAYYGAWALNSDTPETALAAAQARIAASEAYWYGAKENVQVHGGWASLGSSTAISTTAAASSSRLLQARRGSGKSGWSAGSNATTWPERRPQDISDGLQ